MAWPNSCRQTENTQRIVTVRKQVMTKSFHRQDQIIPFSFAKEQMLAEQQILPRHQAIALALANVVHINSAPFNLLSRLALGRTQTGVNQQLNQRRAGAFQL